MLDLKAAMYGAEHDAKGGVEKPRVKPSAKPLDQTLAGAHNPGVAGRSAKDALMSHAEQRAASLALQRKAQIYEKLIKGELAGQSESFL